MCAKNEQSLSYREREIERGGMPASKTEKERQRERYLYGYILK